MSDPTTQSRKIEKPFSPIFFLLIIVLTLSVFAGILKITFPNVWAIQFGAHWYEIIFVFIIAHFLASFVEFFFHRYFLHAYPFAFLRRFYRQHTLHHSLTSVRLVTLSDKKVISSHYPILEEAQYEASYFPWFSLSIFIFISLPLMGLIQWIMPTTPILIGTILAITWSLILYEFIHAVEHLSYDNFWRSKINNRRWGRIWRLIYSFHIRHHAYIKCNEAVGGFFGIPLPDFIFGTYISSKTLLIDGTTANEKDFSTPMPCLLIRFLDQLSTRRMKKLKTVS